jgi:hypothetical protein
MYSVNIRGYDITCESTQEVLELVGAAAIPEPKQTRPTPPRATTGKERKKVTAAQKKARAKKAREGYKAKQEAKKQEAKRLIQSALTKKDAEAEAIATAREVVTTAEKHHGAKEKRADTGGDIISALRRSGLPLTIPEIRDDLQKAGWKYNGPDPKGTIRATLNRLVTKGEVAKGSNNGALTFRIARVEHADPLPHQQRESDV